MHQTQIEKAKVTLASALAKLEGKPKPTYIHTPVVYATSDISRASTVLARLLARRVQVESIQIQEP